MLHTGKRQPPKSSLAEIDPHSPRDPGYRVPRVVADLVAARPIHLAVIDGIETVAGGEGPWVKKLRPVKPGLLIAGTNCVSHGRRGDGADGLRSHGRPRHRAF